ncbi:MAG TPA: hypothetical protein VFY78_05460, partial [Gammaproteobacteria bacterium]|nr:hypothetical protein [Gammaproteobacteria bacterium]
TTADGFVAPGSGFGISTGTTANGNDFYDGGMLLAVDGVAFVNPDSTVDLTGNTVTTDTVTNIIPGVNAQIKYTFMTTRATVRAVYTLTNTTGSAISTSAMVYGNLGSDGSTTVQATSSGDAVIEDADVWIITDDNTTVSPTSDGGDPTSTFATHGANATVVPVTAQKPGAGDDYFGYRYDVTIPAKSTVRIMVFNEMSNDVPTALANASDYESANAADAAGLLEGMTAAELETVVNYKPTYTSENNSGIGATGLSVLFSMLGVLGFFRSRKK